MHAEELYYRRLKASVLWDHVSYRTKLVSELRLHGPLCLLGSAYAE